MLSENVAGNIIPYSKLCRIVEIHREKDEQQTSHFWPGKGPIDTYMLLERTVVQFIKREHWMSTVEIGLKFTLLGAAGRHSSVELR